LTYDDTGEPIILEVQVHHFSGIQAGLFDGGLPFIGIDDIETSTGGCFIDTMTGGTTLLAFRKSSGYLSLVIVLVLMVALLWKRRA
jgi:hypothetical protein